MVAFRLAYLLTLNRILTTTSTFSSATTLPPSSSFIAIPLIKLPGSIPLDADGLPLSTMATHRRHVEYATRRLAMMSESSRSESPRNRKYFRGRHRRTLLADEDSGPEMASDGLNSSTTTSATDNNADTTFSSYHGKSVESHSRVSDLEVTKSHPAKHAHSAGLDIEGQDIGYMAVISIGTPPRPFNLLVDSGSGDFWVGGEGCRSDVGGGCGDHQFLGSQSSSTFRPTNTTWSITYGSGAVSGLLVQDHVVFAGKMRLANHTFGVAYNESSEFTADNIPLDGVLGCGKQVRTSRCNLLPPSSTHCGLLVSSPKELFRTRFRAF
ncbi:Aspartic peptidase A1 [Mycena indigotica]|uniref:Aspartic peptidase A1 n=1 Tax=Mycena indigotica TaxID=2126181 RepID=A0A8H6T6S0_9AGAR|nr:Aspartic peptidase A1 [Mycena indigotica]KAF7312113.1 Aspartic peptidase A1 [Mycena indigotica]